MDLVLDCLPLAGVQSSLLDVRRLCEPSSWGDASFLELLKTTSCWAAHDIPLDATKYFDWWDDTDALARELQEPRYVRAGRGVGVCPEGCMLTCCCCWC